MNIMFYQENPIMVRNAPPVAGAIYWSRQLLKRIEDPMKIFRDNKAVTSLADFGRQVQTLFPYPCVLKTFNSHTLVCTKISLYLILKGGNKIS